LGGVGVCVQTIAVNVKHTCADTHAHTYTNTHAHTNTDTHAHTNTDKHTHIQTYKFQVSLTLTSAPAPSEHAKSQ